MVDQSVGHDQLVGWLAVRSVVTQPASHSERQSVSQSVNSPYRKNVSASEFLSYFNIF